MLYRCMCMLYFIITYILYKYTCIHICIYTHVYIYVYIYFINLLAFSHLTLYRYGSIKSISLFNTLFSKILCIYSKLDWTYFVLGEWFGIAVSLIGKFIFFFLLWKKILYNIGILSFLEIENTKLLICTIFGAILWLGKKNLFMDSLFRFSNFLVVLWNHTFQNIIKFVNK